MGEGKRVLNIHFFLFYNIYYYMLVFPTRIFFILFEVGKNLHAESFEHTSSDRCQTSAVWKNFYLIGR